MKNLQTIQLSGARINFFLIAILLLNFLLHIQIISVDIQGMHDWRQTQTMWNIKNFVDQDANILNPRVSHYNHNHDNIYRYEFPIMQWAIAMVQKLLGQHIEIVRIMVFLISIWGALGFFRLLRQLDFEAIPALSGFLFYLFSPVVFYYMINPMPDNLALASVMWYLYSIVRFHKQRTKKYLLFASVFLLLATLAKLPFLMLSIVSIFYFANDYIRKLGNWKDPLVNAVVQLAILSPALVWYYYVMPGWKGNGVLTGIFGMDMDIMANLRILRYHLYTMFPQILLSAPVWIPFFVGLYWSRKRFAVNKWFWFIVGITFTYLILQWSVIGIVHDYYFFPFLPWLYLLVTNGIAHLVSKKRMRYDLIVILSLIASPIFTYFISMHKWENKWRNKDLYTHREALISAVPDDEKCIILNDRSTYIFAYQINKKGYIFDKDYLPAHWVKDLIENRDIKYLYSDSRIFEAKDDIKPMLDSLILDAGEVHVYRLKSE